MEIFCILMNVFNVTFDQLNASSLNKSINLFFFLNLFLTPDFSKNYAIYMINCQNAKKKPKTT